MLRPEHARWLAVIAGLSVICYASLPPKLPDLPPTRVDTVETIVPVEPVPVVPVVAPVKPVPPPPPAEPLLPPMPPAAFGLAKVVQHPTPRDAVQSAHADILKLECEPAYTRYVFSPRNTVQEAATISFVLNSVLSRADINFPPGTTNSPIQYVDEYKLIRFDLLRLAGEGDGSGRDAKLIAGEIAELWDKIFNPFFIIEDEHLADIADQPDVQELVKHKIFGPHVDQVLAAELQEFTASVNAIVHYRSFYDALLTAEGDAGLYYEFAEIPKANAAQKEKGFSDLDALLDRLGVSLGAIDKLRADQRAALTVSGVTGKPRRIDLFSRPARLGSNQGLFVITWDMKDNDYDPNRDPWLNILEFVPFGAEAIFERNNGHLAYALYDGNGQLVDTAPDVLVKDHTIPDVAGTARLQPAISCIVCHGTDGSGGMKPFRNHVREATRLGLDIYDDQSGAKQKLNLDDTLAKLARLYAGDLAKPIQRCRDDHSDAIVVATHGAKTTTGLPMQFRDVASLLHERFTEYKYTPMTAAKVCYDLGFEIPARQPDQERHAQALLRLLLGRRPPEIEPPIQTEDPRLWMPANGIPVYRIHWEVVYIDAAVRAQATLLQTPLEKLIEAAWQEGKK